MIPAIKTYNIDYEFIINNYTDIKLWDKVWTLFEFKDYVFTLVLDSIDVQKKQISFEIKLSSHLDIWSNTKKAIFFYDTRNMNLNMLKRLINSNMERLIESLENEYIEAKDVAYNLILKGIVGERERLRDIAKDFLDDNNVSNEEIRDVYIDYYVDKNESIYNQASFYKDSIKYTYLTDLYLIYAETTNNKDLKEKIIQNQHRDISTLIKEVEEFMEYLKSDEYLEKMQDKLEEI